MDVKNINFGARVDFNDFSGLISPEEQKKIICKISGCGSDNYRYIISTGIGKKNIAMLDVFYKCGDKDVKMAETTKVCIGKNSLNFFRNLTAAASSRFDFLSKQKHLY